ncbi:hypothetical protein [Winogradskyella poriferorum]|uniref:hypothetical protein n=1 Tax=Winogradskyella poriferorum TaxID=307627 RepID=UPI003D65DA4E
MARDYTKYNVEGLGENLNKRKLVFTIVNDWVEKNNPSFEDLQKAFPDQIQGSKGVVKKEAEVKDPKRYNVKEPLKIKNGAHVVVCNQWGENINDFIVASEELGYQINTNDQNSTLGKEKNGNIKEAYLNYFQNQTFDEIYDFIEQTNKLFENFSWESESDCEEIADLYNDLHEITLKDCVKYGGYLYVFTEISDKMGEGEYDTYFDWDIATEYGYDWYDMIQSEETVVHKVATKYGQSEFDKYFASLFVLTLLRIVDNADSEEIAEFIVANDVSAYKEVFTDTDDSMEDFVSDMVIDLLKSIGYDIYDYEGECAVNGLHFLDVGLDMGYDYIKLAEDFRDSNI